MRRTESIEDDSAERGKQRSPPQWLRVHRVAPIDAQVLDHYALAAIDVDAGRRAGEGKRRPVTVKHKVLGIDDLQIRPVVEHVVLAGRHILRQHHVINSVGSQLHHIAARFDAAGRQVGGQRVPIVVAAWSRDLAEAGRRRKRLIRRGEPLRRFHDDRGLFAVGGSKPPHQIVRFSRYDAPLRSGDQSIPFRGISPISSAKASLRLTLRDILVERLFR